MAAKGEHLSAETKHRLRYSHGIYHSIKAGDVLFRSSYELRYYRLLDIDDAVTMYECEVYSIEYYCEGRMRHYIPDLYISYVNGSYKHIEIKPERYLNLAKNVCKFETARMLLGEAFMVVTECDLHVLELLHAKKLLMLATTVSDYNKLPKLTHTAKGISDEEYWHTRSSVRESAMSAEDKSVRSKRGWDTRRKNNKGLTWKLNVSAEELSNRSKHIWEIRRITSPDAGKRTRATRIANGTDKGWKVINRKNNVSQV